MADHEASRTEGPSTSPAGVLNDEQRATFRAAGFWMAIIGWVEVIFGVCAGLVGLLAALGVVGEPEVGVAGSERRLFVLQAIGSIIIGVLTLITARSFGRAGRQPAAGFPAVTAAVADLAELYERQVWFAFVLFVIAVGGALAQLWW